MLPLKRTDRVRILAAVAHRGPSFRIVRIVVITLSLAILLAIPLLGIVRVDLWRGHHRLLGADVDVISALKGFVVAMAILYGLTFLSNMVVGRFFCGWGCPVGYVSRLGEDVTTSQKRRKKVLQHLLGAGFVATFVAAVMVWWVDPAVVLHGSWTARGVTLAIFGILWGGGFLHAFVWRFGFCLNVCPIGLYYRYVTSKAPVGIVFSNLPSPCIECGSCERICPVDLDPKNLGQMVAKEADETGGGSLRYGDAECLRCGDCIEACRVVFAKRPGESPPLRFGTVLTDSGDATRDG